MKKILRKILLAYFSEKLKNDFRISTKIFHLKKCSIHLTNSSGGQIDKVVSVVFDFTEKSSDTRL